MGSNLNFKNLGNEPPGGDCSGRASVNFPLTGQSSVYSLTFDEFQNSLGGIRKNFGSMNMDELLKNIWSAEETQSMATAAAAAVGGRQEVAPQGGYLQRGSLTLPRTISQKTVDQVWKDIAKEFNSGKDRVVGSNAPQGQHTLGEITLEEFLVRAGVVMEDAQVLGTNNIGGIFGNVNGNNNTGFGINFQQTGGRSVETMGNCIQEGSNLISVQPTSLPINFNGVRTSLKQPSSQLPQPQPQQQQPQQQPQISPKQFAASYTCPMTLPSNGPLGSPGIRRGNVGLADQSINGNVVPALPGGGMGLFGLGGGAIDVPTGSPATLLSDGLAKSNDDTSSVSPVAYTFNGGGLRGKNMAVLLTKLLRDDRGE